MTDIEKRELEKVIATGVWKGMLLAGSFLLFVYFVIGFVMASMP